MKAAELLAELNNGHEHPVVSYRQLDHWLTSGLVTPDNAGRQTGSGRIRELNDEEIFIIRLMTQLTQAGFLASKAGTIARFFLENRYAKAYMISDNFSLYCFHLSRPGDLLEDPA